MGRMLVGLDCLSNKPEFTSTGPQLKWFVMVTEALFLHHWTPKYKKCHWPLSYLLVKHILCQMPGLFLQKFKVHLSAVHLIAGIIIIKVILYHIGRCCGWKTSIYCPPLFANST